MSATFTFEGNPGPDDVYGIPNNAVCSKCGDWAWLKESLYSDEEFTECCDAYPEPDPFGDRW